jgi:RNA polymerase sigma factor (sigma-70 family)
MEQSVLSRPARTGVPSLRLAFVGDERLARLVTEGDEAAFGLLYNRYHQPIYRYCRSLVHDEVDAQDAFQSTFTSALGALQRGQRNAPIRPWLFRIAHNESISLLRRRPADQELSELEEPRTVSLEERVEERETLALLVSDLGELPERQRGALVMRELSDLSHEEIALALETSVNAAKQTIFEARRSLTEFAEGREMPCDDVCRIVSDHDGRVLRSRRVRAHLRHCSSCRAFAAAISERGAQLRALAPPIPVLAAGGMLARVLGNGSAHGGNGGAGLLATSTGKAVGTAIAVKVGAVAVAVTATAVGVTAVLKQPMPVPHPAPATNAVTTASPGAGATTSGQAATAEGAVASSRHGQAGGVVLIRGRNGRLVPVARAGKLGRAGHAAAPGSAVASSSTTLGSTHGRSGSRAAGRAGGIGLALGRGASSQAGQSASAHGGSSNASHGLGASRGSSSSHASSGSSSGNAQGGGLVNRPAHPVVPPKPPRRHATGTTTTTLSPVP